MVVEKILELVGTSPKMRPFVGNNVWPTAKPDNSNLTQNFIFFLESPKYAPIQILKFDLFVGKRPNKHLNKRSLININKFEVSIFFRFESFYVVIVSLNIDE